MSSKAGKTAVGSAYGPDYYERQYRDYAKQNPPRKLAFYRCLVEGLVDRSVRPRILDVGCAFGAFLGHLGDGWDRFGMDASEYAIEKAISNFPEVKFAVSGEEIPFAGPFDVVTAFDVLEHIKELEPALERIHRNLVPGGSFVFVVPVYDGPLGWLVEALDKDPTHVHRKSREFWLRLGCDDFRLREWCGIFRYLLAGGYYVHITTRVWKRYAPAIACLLRR